MPIGGGTGRALAFSEADDQYISTYYPTHGPAHVARKLQIHRSSAWKRAGELGVVYGDKEGYVPVRYIREAVAPEGGAVGHDGILKAARHAGKILRLSKTRVLIEREWAEDYIRARKEREENAHSLPRVGYLSLPQAAKRMGVGRTTLARALRTDEAELRGLLAVLAKLKVFKSRYGGFLFNPHEVEATRRDIKRERDKLARLTPMRKFANRYNLNFKCVEGLIVSSGMDVIKSSFNGPETYYLSADQERVLLNLVAERRAY